MEQSFAPNSGASWENKQDRFFSFRAFLLLLLLRDSEEYGMEIILQKAQSVGFDTSIEVPHFHTQNWKQSKAKQSQTNPSIAVAAQRC